MGARVSTIARVSADDNHRSSRLANLLVVAAWIAVAVIANVIFALTPAKTTGSALLPQHAQTSTTSRIAKAFPGTGTNAIAYLVLEGRGTLGPDDQNYYDAAVSASARRHQARGIRPRLVVRSPYRPDGNRPRGPVRYRTGVAGGRGRERPGAGIARSCPVGGPQLPPTAGVTARITVPATTNGMPLHMSAWQGAAIVVVVAAIAALLLRARQSRKAAGIMLLTAGLSIAVAWPLAGLVLGHLGGNMFSVFSVFSGTLASCPHDRHDHRVHHAACPAQTRRPHRCG